MADGLKGFLCLPPAVAPLHFRMFGTVNKKENRGNRNPYILNVQTLVLHGIVVHVITLSVVAFFRGKL